jgi:hypothetical protein
LWEVGAAAGSADEESKGSMDVVELLHARNTRKLRALFCLYTGCTTWHTVRRTSLLLILYALPAAQCARYPACPGC